MLTRIIKDGKAWVESAEGFKFEAFMWNGNDSSIAYTEGNRVLALDAVFWHDSKEDRKADIGKMSDRQMRKYFERTVTLIYVPDVLRWHNTNEVVSAEDRARILANIQSACQLEDMKPRFINAAR